MEAHIAPVAEVGFRDLFRHARAFGQVFVVVDEVIAALFEGALVEARIFARLGWGGHADGAGKGEGRVFFIFVWLLVGLLLGGGGFEVGCWGWTNVVWGRCGFWGELSGWGLWSFRGVSCVGAAVGMDAGAREVRVDYEA